MKQICHTCFCYDFLKILLIILYSRYEDLLSFIAYTIFSSFFPIILSQSTESGSYVIYLMSESSVTICMFIVFYHCSYIYVLNFMTGVNF